MGKWAPKISAARVQSLVDENWILNLTELAWSFANTTMLSARAIALNVYDNVNASIPNSNPQPPINRTCLASLSK
jgi:hypothetical protein